MVLADLQAVRDYVRALFDSQRERAQLEAVPPNGSVSGDAAARAAFWELLAAPAQRRLFLDLVADRSFWPRLRTLVGAPPYPFLLPGDDGVLNPAGIGVHRAHMARQDNDVTPYAAFVKGHYEDTLGRLYKIVARRKAPAAQPWELPVSGEQLVLDVRIRRASMQTKIEAAQGKRGAAAQAALEFPRPGATLTLRATKAFDAVDGVREAIGDLRVIVRIGRVPKPGAPVARLVVDVT